MGLGKKFMSSMGVEIVNQPRNKGAVSRKMLRDIGIDTRPEPPEPKQKRDRNAGMTRTCRDCGGGGRVRKMSKIGKCLKCEGTGQIPR